MDAISCLEITLGTSFCSSDPLLPVLVAMPCVWRTISNLIINLIKCLSAISIQNKLPTATEGEEDREREREREKADTSIPLNKKRTINTHVCVSLWVCVIQPAALGALTNDVNAAQAQPCLPYPPKKGLAGSLLFIRRENIKQTTGWNYYIGLGLAGKRQEQAITNYISHIRRMGCTCHWAAHHQHYRHSPSSWPSLIFTHSLSNLLSTCRILRAVFTLCLFWLSAKAVSPCQRVWWGASSPMKRVCKQTFDIALFTAPAVRALERFMLYVSVIIYFICYMYTILWHLLSTRVHRGIHMYMACILCVYVCVRYAQLVCCAHSHTLTWMCIKIEISAAIKTNLWADFNMRYLCMAHISIPPPSHSLSHSEVGVIAFLCWAFVGLHVFISAHK